MSFTQAPSITMDPNTFQFLDPNSTGGASVGTSPLAFTNPYTAALSIIGNVGTGLLQRNVLNQQNDIANSDILAQEGYQKQINDALAGLLGGMSKDTPAKAEATALGDYRAALDSALPAGYGSTDANYGKRYSVGAASEQAGRHAQALHLAGQLAKVTAPQTMRRDEGYNVMGFGNTANKFRNFAAGQMGADRLLMQGTHANPIVAEILGALRYI